MREEGNKLLYVTPVFDMLVFYNDILLCQSGNVIIDPEYDDDSEFPIP